MQNEINIHTHDIYVPNIKGAQLFYLVIDKTLSLSQGVMMTIDKETGKKQVYIEDTLSDKERDKSIKAYMLDTPEHAHVLIDTQLFNSSTISMTRFNAEEQAQYAVPIVNSITGKRPLKGEKVVTSFRVALASIKNIKTGDVYNHEEVLATRQREEEAEKLAKRMRLAKMKAEHESKAKEVAAENARIKQEIKDSKAQAQKEVKQRQNKQLEQASVIAVADIFNTLVDIDLT